jgi:hypothetical protein
MTRRERILKKAGINVKALDEQSRRWVEKETKAHKELSQVEPPPSTTERKERIDLDKVAALAGSHTGSIRPPLTDGAIASNAVLTWLWER